MKEGFVHAVTNVEKTGIYAGFEVVLPRAHDKAHALSQLKTLCDAFDPPYLPIGEPDETTDGVRVEIGESLCVEDVHYSRLIAESLDLLREDGADIREIRIFGFHSLLRDQKENLVATAKLTI